MLFVLFSWPKSEGEFQCRVQVLAVSVENMYSVTSVSSTCAVHGGVTARCDVIICLFFFDFYISPIRSPNKYNQSGVLLWSLQLCFMRIFMERCPSLDINGQYELWRLGRDLHIVWQSYEDISGTQEILIHSIKYEAQHTWPICINMMCFDPLLDMYLLVSDMIFSQIIHIVEIWLNLKLLLFKCARK